MKVVIDTNVLVSGLLTIQGNAAAILNLLLNGDLIVLYDERIMNEYEAVLTRKKFGFEKNDVKNLLHLVRYFGEPVAANPTAFALNDTSDLPFLEVAETIPADYLITGNLRDYPISGTKACILSPQDFLRTNVTIQPYR